MTESILQADLMSLVILAGFGILAVLLNSRIGDIHQRISYSNGDVNQRIDDLRAELSRSEARIRVRQ